MQWFIANPTQAPIAEAINAQLRVELRKLKKPNAVPRSQYYKLLRDPYPKEK